MVAGAVRLTSQLGLLLYPLLCQRFLVLSFTVPDTAVHVLLLHLERLASTGMFIMFPLVHNLFKCQPLGSGGTELRQRL